MITFDDLLDIFEDTSQQGLRAQAQYMGGLREREPRFDAWNDLSLSQYLLERLREHCANVARRNICRRYNLDYDLFQGWDVEPLLDFAQSLERVEDDMQLLPPPPTFLERS